MCASRPHSGVLHLEIIHRVFNPEMGKPIIPRLFALESWLLNIYQNSSDKEPPHCSNTSSGLGFILLNALVIFLVLLKFLPHNFVVRVLWGISSGLTSQGVLK